jgi:DNA-binding response OmpR family regulator
LEKEQEEALRLKELDSFKSRLYTNLTHEFRTPLSVILGMAEQIRSNPKAHLKEGLQLIDRNGRHLLQLINQLLDLSKLESNSFQLQLRQGDIIPYLRYVTESFQTYANGRNLSLQFFTTLELMVMDYDPEQIKQIMTNLISNAVKFTASGGSIKVRISKEEDYLQIDVIDTGIGIAEKDLVQIFDRFYQVDGSITRKGEGTGIGLAHTQELVKLMEGKINVESKLRQGSTFTVLLPINQNAEPLLEIPKIESIKMDHLAVPAVINKGDLISPTNDLPKLLIIEDNPDVVHYLKSCLKEGYQLEVAFNGAIGIEKAFEIIPDLVISDVMMPGKDGYEVCDILKNDERTSHIPIILLTAKADADSRLSGLKVGVDAYLAKPFDKTELLIRLEMLVKKQQKLTAYFARKFQDGITSNLTVEEAEIAPKEQAFIQKIGQVIEDNYSDENFSLPQLCLEIGMSRSQLYRKIKALTNSSPSDFIRKYRLEKAKALLTTEDLTVNEVAWKVGFKDTSHFSKSFYAEFGFRPGAINK